VLCHAVGSKAAVPLTQPPQPMPPALPAVGSTLPTEGAVHAEARVIVPPPPPDRQTGWKDLAVGREIVYRRSAPVFVAYTELPPEPARPPAPAPMVTVSTEPDWRTAPPAVSPPVVQVAPAPTPAPAPPPLAPKPQPAEEPLNWNKAKEK
jgi:hypothetical protein